MRSRCGVSPVVYSCDFTAKEAKRFNSTLWTDLQTTRDKLRQCTIHFEICPGELCFDHPCMESWESETKIGASLSLWLFIFSLRPFLPIFVFISWSFSASLFPAFVPRFSWSFPPHLSISVSLSTPMQHSLFFFPALFFPLFFPPLSPGNQTSGEECWVSTFPEKRTIWATQRPTMDPLCSLLPSLCHCSCTHRNRLTYIRIHTPCSCYSSFLLTSSFSVLHLSCFSSVCLASHVAVVIDTLSCMWSNSISFLLLWCFYCCTGNFTHEPCEISNILKYYLDSF